VTTPPARISVRGGSSKRGDRGEDKGDKRGDRAKSEFQKPEKPEKGRRSVTDFHRHKTVEVPAGHSYFAKTG
jgi:hypothetical protein